MAWSSEDVMTLDYFNNLVERISNIAVQFSFDELSFSKVNGDFLFSEELEEIEETLQNVSNVLLPNYEKKDFYNLSTFSYEELNKWEQQLGLIEERQDYFNNLVKRISDIAVKFSFEELVFNKTNGEFLSSEELEEIEETLQDISNVLLLDYEKKDSYSSSTFNYEDFNRWEQQLGLIEEKMNNIKIFKYSDDVSSTADTYVKLLYEEV